MARVLAVGHVGLNARDLPALASFYRDVVGLRQILFREGVVAIFAIDGRTDFFLVPGEPGSVEFDFSVDDVDGFRAKLVAAGVDCTEVKNDRRTGHQGFAFRDLEGNEMWIRSAHERA